MIDEKSYSEHGGDIFTEGEFRGINLIDFSSNINFLGLPKTFIRNIDSALNEIIRYPDLKYRETKRNLKEYLRNGINEDNIILGNGAAEIINLVISKLKRPCIVIPSFSEYETSAKSNCEEIIYSRLNEDFTYNYKDILEKLTDCDGLVIANPNNPNGGIIDKDSFHMIINYCEENYKKVIIDESFIEFINDNGSFIDKCSDFKSLFIIRALTKFFALPGVRFGYGVCSDISFIKSLSKLQIPWNVNTFAEIAVRSVLKDEEYIMSSRAIISKERNNFVRALETFNFIEKIYESQANFLLIKLNGISGEMLYAYCLSNGVLIRRCKNFRGLDDRFIRLAVKNREDNHKLINIFMNLETEITRGNFK